MPRPSRARTSLPGHSKAAKIKAQIDDDGDDSMMMDSRTESQDNLAHQEQLSAEDTLDDVAPSRPANKPKKIEKQLAKREALLARITAGATPYSKSHARRLKRAEKPQNNLVTSLTEVQDVLQQVTAQVEEEAREEEEQAERVIPGRAGPGGKGQSKLTAKKRNRVLTSEAARLPAVINNSAFKANPFATIRTHTLNNLAMAKNEAANKQPGKKSRT